MINICIAGCTGWTGGAVTRAVLASDKFKLAAAMARQATGQDAGTALGLPAAGVTVTDDIEKALSAPADVFIDYTRADSVRRHVFAAIDKGMAVVIGASGLTGDDFAGIDKAARARGVGVVAAGNFSITAALAKRCALLAAAYVPSWEIIDYADPHKPDAPSGTTRELADALARVRDNHVDIPVEKTIGAREARGATVGGAQLHSLRLPGFRFSFETVFGMTGERLSIRHDAGDSAEPYVAGTLLAAEKALSIKGLVRGMDTLLFGESA